MSYRIVLLDLDGTLIDSNDAHAQAWVRALAEAGQAVSFTRVRPLIGMGGDKVLPALTCIDPDSQDGQKIASRRTAIFSTDFLPTLAPTAGSRQLLEHLQAAGLRLVVATSAKADEVSGLLRRAGVGDLIDAASSSDDADRSKPDPDSVHAALGRARCAADEAIMIGDTPYDLEAAANAGVAFIAVRCGGWWADEAFAGAAGIYDDPADLLARMDASPLQRPAPLHS
jgi:HAD superfamily hydrolase (TIGR01509 family)